MSKTSIVFSNRASERLESITEYLLEKTQSSSFVISYINELQNYLETVLVLFPESGCLMEQYGLGIRRAVYKEYSFIYQINGNNIEVLTIYKENLP
jgi:plasmid stabilization system protein ParE